MGLVARLDDDDDDCIANSGSAKGYLLSGLP